MSIESMSWPGAFALLALSIGAVGVAWAFAWLAVNHTRAVFGEKT